MSKSGGSVSLPTSLNPENPSSQVKLAPEDSSSKDASVHAFQNREAQADVFGSRVATLAFGSDTNTSVNVIEEKNKQVQNFAERIAMLEISFNRVNTQAGICAEKVITNQLALDAQLLQINACQIERNSFMVTQALKDCCILTNKVSVLESDSIDLQNQLDMNFIGERGLRRVLERIIDALHLDIHIQEEIDADEPAVDTDPPLQETPLTADDSTAVDPEGALRWLHKSLPQSLA
ncbi:hypothetical protein DFH28DRAFT_925891 [Melampsora americana]|nr:hypothetical protein DFH28DRAFT_934943 [Melampsora americana]KAH9818407.1 hypothetical protein DFH28DRAFT_925891 [Melampsora americana]